jgi:hypothetical protein
MVMAAGADERGALSPPLVDPEPEDAAVEGERPLEIGDPDDNGVELYWDRPESLWTRDPDGGLAMYTRPLDLEDLLAT